MTKEVLQIVLLTFLFGVSMTVINTAVLNYHARIFNGTAKFNKF